MEKRQGNFGDESLTGGITEMKITFIGAGSVVFTRNLVKDILAFPKLKEDTVIYLEDIDPHRIPEPVAEVVQRCFGLVA